MTESERVIPDARHEPTDMGPGFIWGAVAVCSSTLLACALLVYWLYPQSRADDTLQLPLPIYPAPRLQPDPPADMRRLQTEEMQVLDGTGWADEKRGTVHIPIARAMEEVARDGIVGWPGADEPAP